MAKLKTCKACKGKFIPERDFQNTCDYKCAIKHAKNLQAKKEAREAQRMANSAGPRRFENRE